LVDLENRRRSEGEVAELCTRRGREATIRKGGHEGEEGLEGRFLKNKLKGEQKRGQTED
jgi:hypothetical protein